MPYKTTGTDKKICTFTQNFRHNYNKLSKEKKHIHKWVCHGTNLCRGRQQRVWSYSRWVQVEWVRSNYRFPRVYEFNHYSQLRPGARDRHVRPPQEQPRNWAPLLRLPPKKTPVWGLLFRGSAAAIIR